MGIDRVGAAFQAPPSSDWTHIAGRDEHDQHFGTALYRIGVVADLLRLSGARDIEKIKPLMHPDMRVIAAAGIAPQASRPGREGFLDYFRDTEAQGILLEPDAYEIHACLSGKVLVAGSIRFTTSKSTTETSIYYVYAFQDALISCLETHLGREAAEEAAGSLDFEGMSS